MARIRTIKPKFFDDLKIGRLSRDARLLYIGLWIFADDCGVIIADMYWLRSKVFPYDQIQMQQFEKWIAELVKTGFICLFSYKDEEFIYLPTFTRHQKIDKPNYEDLNVPKNLLDKLIGQIGEQSENNRRTIGEQSPPIEDIYKDIYNITISKEIEEETSSSALAQVPSNREVVDIKRIIEMYHSVCVDYPKLVKMSPSRKNKIKIRFQEMAELAESAGYADAYQVLQAVLQKMQDSAFMRGDSNRGWKADFDWLIDNDKNWLKVLEGKYDNTAGITSGQGKKSEIQKSVEFQQKMGVTESSIVF